MKLPPFIGLLALGFLVPAAAQPIFDHAESLELTVLNADIVVVGKIVSITEEGEKTLATIEVEETLKGEHREKRDVAMTTNIYGTHLWKAGPERRVLTAREDHPIDRGLGVVELAPETRPVLKSDFTQLWKPREILREARAIVRRMPGVVGVRSFRLTAPRELFKDAKWQQGTGLLLTVPVGEQLRKHSLELIKNNSIYKYEGAQALRYFRSAENIELAKSLIDDPAWAYERQAIYNKGVEVRKYLVRQAAYEALRGWGVDVKQPVTREEIFKPEAVTLAVLSLEEDPEEEMELYRKFPNLNLMVLRNSKATNHTLRRLSEMKNLRSLELGGGITDAGLVHLKDLKLDYLSLNRGITDAGLRQIAEFKGIKKLDIGGAKVSPEAVAALKKQRPDMVIEP